MNGPWAIVWMDSEVSTMWLNDDEIDVTMGLAPVLSVGFITKENDMEICLAGDIGHEENDFRNRHIAIAKACIVSMDLLTLAEEE